MGSNILATIALLSFIVSSNAGLLHSTSISVKAGFSRLSRDSSTELHLGKPPPPTINQDPPQLSGCIAKSEANAAFNIYVRASNYSLPWPHKNYTFTFGGLGGNIIQRYNDTTQQATEQYLGLPQNFSLSSGDYNTQLSLYSLLKGKNAVGPRQSWWLCAPPAGPGDPDWQAWFYLGVQSTFLYCRFNGQIYQSAPVHVENFYKKYMCDPVELLISHNPQNIYNGHMSDSTEPVSVKRQLPYDQTLQGSPKAPIGDYSDPQCNDTQASLFRLVEIPVNADPESEGGPLDWDAAFLPAGETLWTLQHGSLATVEQGASNLRLVVKQQDRQIQTTGNANWANIEWNTGWSLCGDLQELAIAGSTIFADCGGEVRYNNVTRGENGSILNQDGLGPDCHQAVFLGVTAGEFPNPNTKRAARRFADFYMQQPASAPSDHQERENHSVMLSLTRSQTSPSVTAVTYVHTSVATVTTTTLIGRYPLPNGTAAGSIDTYHGASADSGTRRHTEVIYLTPGLPTTTASPSSTVSGEP